ncbi:hypothetical protein ACLD4I_21200, partial [Salmonella sp. 741265044_PST]|uniref:hypothetical protein n=1 Tax=Salmonella sp. 741265044_PST TaxID=3388969 RepID=UPI0039806E28
MIIAILSASSSLKVRRIWCIREDYSPYGSPFGPLLTQRYPSDASGDYRYLICIFIAESTENMVHPG